MPDDIILKNVDNPFTELFSLLKRYKNISQGILTLAYSSSELKIMQQHIDNAMDVLFHGLQEVGHLLSIFTQQKNIATENITHLGFFISAVVNLTEALNTLRLDAEYVLKHRNAG